MSARQANRRGMTMLEVLLAVSMLGLLLVAAATLCFALSRSYFALETAPQFDRHADGVTDFLYYLASASETRPDEYLKSFDWSRSPADEKFTLSWKIDQEVPFFVTDTRPLPPLSAFLQYDKENGQFWLLWQTDPKFTEGKPKLQYTLLSPWAKDIEYGYFDKEQKEWEFELASAENSQHGDERPDRIVLIFERAGETLRRWIDIDRFNAHVILY